VAQPIGGHVCPDPLVDEFVLSAGAEILEQLRPGFQASPLDDLLERCPKVLAAFGVSRDNLLTV